MVRDAVKPDVTMFIHYETLECDGKAVVAVNIQRGTNRPYYLAKKGLRPEGVYVRQGYSSVPATDTAIRQMIKETDGDSFENMRSINQALTFEATKKEFEKRNVVFGQPQMQTLKIVSADGIYTNLGLLLSEQCLHTIKAAVFEGINQNVFKDRREFSGSLMQQLNDVYDYIDFHNQTHATFRKLLRIDTRDYPEVAVREALLNTLVHRDYSFRASTLISIYDDRIEFVSIGGLLPGLELDDLMMGVSVCRNPHLANVFYRLQLIEAYGTGMKKIMGAYANALVQPKIKTTNNAFKIILPNVNFTPKAAEVHKDFEKAADLALDSNEEKVLQFLREHLMITRKETQTLLEVSQSTAGRILKAMVDSGRIKQIGGSRTTRYELRKE
ncbi:ATP-binding protein, partial [Phascolarctobacterium succinatutens]